ncbi:hypothetical protein [Acinetobacter junii]|uniref:hypothetical protein n=1 Tax=Acinetobacter junii TaxID=40215 RepID=UPI001BAAD0B8|nr:hypothetical protein [Acinetobacter junii]QUS51156.1 hypothetical protein J5N61_06110 [Acinetobacter junii]
MIKQTQTKYFDFSDVGLDFCAGSKNKFPEVFKKILATGFNLQTASSVSIAGSQITLTFGVNHGYVADRILKVEATGGFNKEIYIDSVTTNTVVCTVLDGNTTGLTGTISTKIAPLGWTLVYENGLVQLYKMKYLDERDLYVRYVFSAGGERRNTINVCTGKTANEVTGEITDENAIDAFKSHTVATNGFEWVFEHSINTSYDNYTYSQGLTTFGPGKIVGSKYHLVFLCNVSQSQYFGRVLAILPTCTLAYSILDYPLVIGGYYTTPVTSSSIGFGNQIANPDPPNADAYLGKTPVSIAPGPKNGFETNQNLNAISSFLPSNIDAFDTTATSTIQLYELTTKQGIGVVAGGLFRVFYQLATRPSRNKPDTPLITYDVDFNNICVLHPLYIGSSPDYTLYMVAPIEEIKIA